MNEQHGKQREDQKEEEKQKYEIEVDMNSQIGFKGLPKEIEQQLKQSNFNQEQI